MHIKRSVLNHVDHVGHSRGLNSWVILVGHFCGSFLWVKLCKYSCNCYHFRWLWRRYGTFTNIFIISKSTRHIFVAKQLVIDLHNFGVELDTELPTKVNIVEDGNSGCEPKRKRIHQKNKLFTSRLEKTRRSKHIFKIRNIESVNAEYCKFQVGSVTLVAHSIKYICVLNLPVPAQTWTLTVWGIRASANCLFCCLHWKWQILTF